MMTMLVRSLFDPVFRVYNYQRRSFEQAHLID